MLDIKTLQFIYKSKKLYKEYNFTYLRTKYINSRTDLIITCPIHGDITISPNNHINNNRSCKKCNDEKRRKKEFENFISKSKKLHKNKYDYSDVIYYNSKTKIKIICPIHGEFEQTPNSHLKGSGCPKCQKNFKLNNDTFKEKANKIHNNKFDYSLVNYIDSQTKIKIVCPKHGIFEQKPYSHLLGNDCLKCSYEKNAEKRRNDTKELEKKFNKIHNYNYKYDLSNYKSISKKIKIICPKHGKFEQTGTHHLNGHGCPKCNQSKGELKIEKLLKENNIKYTYQQKFDKCKNKRKLPFDFYLPDFNTCIEFDGKQHFEIFELFGEESFKRTQKHDKIKNNFCEKNNIYLIRISYLDSDKTIKSKLKSILKNDK